MRQLLTKTIMNLLVVRAKICLFNQRKRQLLTKTIMKLMVSKTRKRINDKIKYAFA